MTIRFPFLIMLSIIIAIFNNQSFYLTLDQTLSVFFLAFSYAIIPLYLLQICIKTLDLFTLTGASASLPLTIFATEWFFKRFSVSGWTFLALIGAFILSVVSLINGYEKYK